MFGLPRRKVKNLSKINLFSGEKKSKFDFQLFATVIGLSIFGLIMVYDASVVQAFKDHGDKYFYIKQQLLWMTLGFLSLVFFSFFEVAKLKTFSGILFIIAGVLLLAVFIPGLGSAGGGAHRWLKIFGFTLQPAEIIKLSAILFYAHLFEKKEATSAFFTTCLGVTLVLGLFQKDLGSAIVFFSIAMTMYFNSGAPSGHFLLMLPLTVIAFLGFIFSSSYRRQRVLAFLDPFADPQGYSYHISQVLIALGSGGLFGLGLGQSKQKFEYIPEVTTDSIFAVIGEELGFLGALVVITLLIFFLFRGFKIAKNAPDKFSRNLSFGLTSWIGLQAVINLGAMVALIPLTGVPLPFISYGGSALLVNLTAVGMLLNISRRS